MGFGVISLGFDRDGLMLVWLVGRCWVLMVGWSVGPAVDWSVGWVVLLIGWVLLGWLVGRMVGLVFLVRWLGFICSVLIGWMLVSWLVGCCWLVGWLGVAG